MEIIIGAVTAFLLAAGVILTAIFQAKGGAEKTLKDLVDKLDEKVTRLEKEKREESERWESRCTEFQKKYDDLFLLYQSEQKRGDRLEKKVMALTKKAR